jgi:hypothetical protein
MIILDYLLVYAAALDQIALLFPGFEIIPQIEIHISAAIPTTTRAAVCLRSNRSNRRINLAISNARTPGRADSG